jgi:ACS family sodium-dependent inorganic phosphate cotransporter
MMSLEAGTNGLAVAPEARGGEAGVWQVRHTQVALLVLCSMINYADRVNISIAVVDMTVTFGWSLGTQAVVLSCFFWGYICSQVVGALLAQRYGGKLVLGSAGLAWSALTVLTPAAASLGLPALVFCRVLLGVAEGFLIPVNSHIVASWMPAEERGRAVSAVLAGCNTGTVVAFLLSPTIMVTMGWQYCFYLFGSAGFVWYALWQVFAQDAPGSVTAGQQAEGIWTQIHAQVGMAKQMLSKKVVLAIAACHWCSAVGNYIGLAWFPTYFNKVWGVDRKHLGVTVVPYLCVIPCAAAFGYATDRLAQRLGLLSARKIANTVGFGVSGFFWLSLPHMTKSSGGAIGWLCLTLAVHTASFSGFETSKLDIVRMAPYHHHPTHAITRCVRGMHTSCKIIATQSTDGPTDF